MTLDQLEPGQTASILGVDWTVLEEGEAKRLRALGIDEGVQIGVAHRGIFGGRDPLAVTLGRMTLALRRVHAAAIRIEPEAGGA
ncbi:MAG: FeoA family protein [Alteripontixanthobacter sp.]